MMTLNVKCLITKTISKINLAMDAMYAVLNIQSIIYKTKLLTCVLMFGVGDSGDAIATAKC